MVLNIILPYFEDFNIDEWARAMRVNATQKMAEAAKKLLFSQLKLDRYISLEQCNINADIYSPSVAGWKDGS